MPETKKAGARTSPAEVVRWLKTSMGGRGEATGK